ncbi:dynein axonemal heavy chain 10, partial [Centruroides vittatus]|uniref:dynein axonemal heavy chain 10 n=1 Tax=Centruroides vittatus TaxID=120091 RepID=UPI00350F46CD
MFDSIYKLKIQSEQTGTDTIEKTVTALISKENEIVEFRKSIQITDKVEQWINNLLTETQLSIKFLIKRAIYEYGKMLKSNIKWLFDYQGMICITAKKIWWTAAIEHIFEETKNDKKSEMKFFSGNLHKEINDIISQISSKMFNSDRKKFNMVLLTMIHEKDIIDRFILNNIISAKEFDWERQLRFYWIRDQDEIKIYQCNGVLCYGFEYIGLNDRLVITPLTERIYFTATQALSLYLGCAPHGPTGTGKTETIKDLAKALALFCVMINCEEEMNYKYFGKILSGLVQSGAWGCFENFNHINASVFSVISTQLKVIQNALILKLKRIQFEGEEISFDSKIGIFITLNPEISRKRELPENLKTYFRFVACSFPDIQLICEIKLFSEGFIYAKVLAKKLTNLYKLAKIKLSKQPHYDFGLLELKCILMKAIKMKRELPDLEEDNLIIQAIKEIDFPKLTSGDIVLYNDLIYDLFPGIEINYSSIYHFEFQKVVEEVMKERNFKILPHQINKIMQIHEIMMLRHAIMIIGPSGGGKSVVINTLMNAHVKLGSLVKTYIINPKAVDITDFYGFINPSSNEWTDGLFSVIFREMNQPAEKSELRFLIFDGDIDSVWIENMNSIMDENKLLTLPNGERIKLQTYCVLLFEVANLQYAPPTTVCRCGMVYVDPVDVGYLPYWERWCLTKADDKKRVILRKLFETYIPDCINYVFKNTIQNKSASQLTTIISRTPLNMITQLCLMLESLLTPDITDQDIIESYFLMAVYWSIGSVFEENERIKFDSFVKSICSFKTFNDGNETFALAGEIPSSLPTLYDYYIDSNKKAWIPWNNLIQSFTSSSTIIYNDMLVPTAETVRLNWLLHQMQKISYPAIVVGETGTSKTITILDFLNSLESDKNTLLTLNFASYTSSMSVQKCLEAKMEKRMKNIYGPSVGKILTIFIDDLNMPKVDEFGTQQPIALLKLLIEHRGIYDIDKSKSWKNFKDFKLMAAMKKGIGGKNEIDPRLISLFCCFSMLPLSDDSIFHIYFSLLEKHTKFFPSEIYDIVSSITKATILLYKTVCQLLLPIPTKLHYSFNIRDLTRVYNGLYLATPKYFRTAAEFIQLWRNECLRVFHDRLSNEEDCKIVTDALSLLLQEYFFENKENVEQEPSLFADFRNSLNNKPRFYECFNDYEEIRRILQNILNHYNKHHIPMNLILFNNALEHIIRVHRVLRMEDGHLLLIGTKGCGKRSLTRLATYAANLHLFEVKPVYYYKKSLSDETLKNLYNRIIIENQKIVFLFSDVHFLNEEILKVINDMLTCGTMSTIFSKREKDRIISMVKAEVTEYGITNENIWQFVEKRFKANLHVVVGISPIGNTLRKIFQNFPGLINTTTIDWFSTWPVDVLSSVAWKFLEKSKFISKEELPNVVECMLKVHHSVEIYSRKFFKLNQGNFVTPQYFLDFIQTYYNLLEEKNMYIVSQSKRIVEGLTKIQLAREQILFFQEKLDEQQIVLKRKTDACNELLEIISLQTLTIKEKQQIENVKAEELKEKHELISREKMEAEVTLSETLSALDAARNSLKEIDKSDITEIRSFVSPPPVVMTVALCICALLGKQTSWKTARAMMSEPTFMENLLNLNVENIPNQNITIMKRLLKSLEPGINTEQIKQISKAGSKLFDYILALMAYYAIFKEIKPKKNKVNQLEEDYNYATDNLCKLRKEIKLLEEELKDSNKKFDDAVSQKYNLQSETTTMVECLKSAGQLITGLGSEEERWKKELEELEMKNEILIGECILFSAFLIYCGPFTLEFRQIMIYEDWKNNILISNIKLKEHFKIEELFVDEFIISRWVSEGLPPDEFSIQNGILTTSALHIPVCIDPQWQALNWIKKKEENNNLKILTLKDSNCFQQLELALHHGHPTLFHNVDEYTDPILFSLLETNIKYKDGKYYFIFEDRELDYDSNFRMYITTKISNPEYFSAIFTEATIINFTLTTKGLETQLLSIIIGTEKKELEEQRERLIDDTNTNKRNLKELEDSLLRELATLTGNVLDNEDLIETLENTKIKAVEINEKLSLAEFATAEIEQSRSAYSPIAKIGAVYFFALSDMFMINNMYHFSLSVYLKVFLSALKNSVPDINIIKRLKNIIHKLTSSVYEFGCIGIFQKHKLLLSFQMALRYLQNEEVVNEEEMKFFINGNISTREFDLKCPCDWLPYQSWKDILSLMHTFPKTFNNLLQSIMINEINWKKWFYCEQPELQPIPDFEDSLNHFQKLLVLRCFRIDRVCLGVKKFVSNILGNEYVLPLTIPFEIIYNLSTPNNPMLFIISHGADPLFEILNFAAKIGFEDRKLKFLSLGQGQEVTALQLLRTAKARGYWLIFQNCHFLINWLNKLEQEIDNKEKVHPDFRLLLTTEPTENFPITILQKSFKVIVEPPSGLKRRLQSLYRKFSDKNLSQCENVHFFPLTYVLAFFHSVILERQKYSKLGWNIIYDFNECDFNFSVDILNMYLKADENHPIPWKTLKFFIGEIIYGGHVTNKFDKRILKTYIDEYMGDFIFDTYQSFRFYCNNEDYIIPQIYSKDEYLEYINSLPQTNTVEILGLHANAEIKFLTKETKCFWESLAKLQSLKADEENDNIYENNLKTAIDIFNKLPKTIITASHQKSRMHFPLTAVLDQELKLFNLLLNKVLSTLQTLIKALSGKGRQDSELEVITHCLSIGKLPPTWKKYSPPTQKSLGGWITHFCERYNQYQKWVASDELTVMWLSGLHFPNSYLISLIQAACHENNWSLDQCSLFTSVTKFTSDTEINEKMPIGSYISGLYLEGASWNEDSGLLEKAKYGELIQPMPILKIIPIENHRIKKQ